VVWWVGGGPFRSASGVVGGRGTVQQCSGVVDGGVETREGEITSQSVDCNSVKSTLVETGLSTG
jgi:hypothetical protein